MGWQGRGWATLLSVCRPGVGGGKFLDTEYECMLCVRTVREKIAKKWRKIFWDYRGTDLAMELEDEGCVCESVNEYSSKSRGELLLG